MLDWEYEEVILNFTQNHWSLINKAFRDLRPTDETGDPNKAHNQFLVLGMHCDHWNVNKYHSVDNPPGVKVLLVTPDREIKNLKKRAFDVPFLNSIPIVLVFQEKDPDPVAMVRIPTIFNEEEWSFGVIRGLWTRRECRRRGYASIAMNRALKWLFEEQELSQVFLYVERTNKPAVALYKTSNWKKENQVLSCYARPHITSY